MHRLRLLSIGLLAAFFTAEVAAASATSARLLLPLENVKPGDSFVAGVELTMKPGWHTYWRNGGDSGSPTTLQWTLPPGVSAGPIRWPAPERYEEAGFVTFVYHGTVILLVPITVAPSVPAGPVELAASVDWLECKEICVKGGTTVKGRFVVADASRPSPEEPLIRAAGERLPKALPPGAATASWDGPAQAEERTLLIQWPNPGATGTPDFFPVDGPTFKVGAATERLAPGPEGVILRKKVRKFEGDWPAQIAGLLVVLDPKQRTIAAFEAALAPGEPGQAAVVATPAAPSVGPIAATGAPGAKTVFTLPKAIGFGFLGGLILNIMPCVLPVIALKILGFVRQSGSHPAEIRRLGLIYALGVWFSFLALAAMVIGVKRAAGFAGWGMQFGNPVFMIALTTLILLVALSLFGVFEITFGGRALDTAGELASKEGPAGAFFNGMLAVALATPCTAPFLAPALGYAFTASAGTILTVFTAIAFGLAAPYVVLSFQPALLRYLPKPGAWMERFKIAMGFPMLATALWLYTLAARHFGGAGPLWLGLFLVGIALAAWVWGEFVQRGRRHQTAAMIAAAAIVAVFYTVALERELRWRTPPAPRTANLPNAAPRGEGIPWEAWSPEAVDAARQAARPVFVDFTADWCLTCKANERWSIEIPAVREKLRAINAVSLKGDYTHFPPEITRELQRFQRAGVPLVLVYPRDPAREPRVLPEVLTPGLVVEELEKAAL